MSGTNRRRFLQSTAAATAVFAISGTKSSGNILGANERLRVAGTRGVVEATLVEDRVTLCTTTGPPRELPLNPQVDLFTRFARSLLGEGAPPLQLHEACRITEVALKAQQAADTGHVVPLGDSPYHEP